MNLLLKPIGIQTVLPVSSQAMAAASLSVFSDLHFILLQLLLSSQNIHRKAL